MEITFTELAEMFNSFASIAPNRPTSESVGKPGAFPIAVGEKIFIRTVTFYYIGELVHIDPEHFVLKNASWIAETGRFSEVMKGGDFSEVEPYPEEFEVIVFRGAVVDCTKWPHSLPSK